MDWHMLRVSCACGGTCHGGALLTIPQKNNFYFHAIALKAITDE